jgi:hypothetical protein
LLRLTQFLSNRSLSLDEAKLALNIVNRSFAQLCKPLDYGQGAPIGFLMLERSALHLFGSGEYALRLFPFLAGMISLLLFYQLAKQSVPTGAVPIALGLFATSAPLIYYSSEVKQYSGDVPIALLLWSAAIYYATCKINFGTRRCLWSPWGGCRLVFPSCNVCSRRYGNELGSVLSRGRSLGAGQKVIDYLFNVGTQFGHLLLAFSSSSER